MDRFNRKSPEKPVESVKKFNKLLLRIPLGLMFLVLLGLYLATGFYTVQPHEIGIVRRFGKFHKQTPPGLHFHLPYPIDHVIKPNVTEIKRIELGFRTIDPGPPARYREIPEESLMITGDLSLVHAEAVIRYRILNPQHYVFHIQDPEATVKAAAEATLRQIIGQHHINNILTTEKVVIQEQSRELLQEILDLYQSGLVVYEFLLQEVAVPDPIREAYRDVASAKEDKEKLINEANAYANKILPEAEGAASRILREAEAYRQAKIEEAEGQVARFAAILEEYSNAQEVTRSRLYLETMEKVLADIEKIIIDESVGALPLLQLEKEVY